MVHSYLPRIFSLRPSESQNITAKQIKPLHHADTKNEANSKLTLPAYSNNNNKGDGFCSSGENCSSEAPNRWPRSNATWTWVPNVDTASSDYNSTLKISNRKLLYALGTGTAVILVISIIVASVFIIVSSKPKSERSHSDLTRLSSMDLISSTSNSNLEDNDSSSSDSDELTKKRIQLERRKASKLSWEMLNRSDKLKTRVPSSHNIREDVAKMEIGDEDEVILPAQMVYTSNTGVESSKKLGSSKASTRSCCRTQKYSQVIKREGCEPLTIVNRMCFGQCVSVWVPGLFASFPVCKPSRSTWKTVTLTCGRKRDRRKRVRVERVRRCSCMEIEPTASVAASL